VSVVLPVRDGELFIGDTLASALGQTYQNLEVIVVDDGSRDRTRAIVEACAERDSRVRILTQANAGVVAARNRAIGAAQGEFVAALDADDLWEPTKIERQVGRMIEAGDGTGLVYCWWATIDVNGAVLDCSPRWQVEGDAAEMLLQVNYTGNASVPLYRRRCVEEVGGYDLMLRDRAEGCEDWDVALKVAERWRVAVVPSALVAYRRRPESLSGRTDRMRRAHALVLNSARQRRPERRPALIRSSEDQFALYLAGVSFWAGAYGQAIGWGLQARGLALDVLPFVLRMFLKSLWRRARQSPRVIRPGVAFSRWQMPEAMIPYDRIYERRLKRLRTE
jgi:cellulose synthase/poly-beta-1,6-N-acetylglucosamine synthase-like glycosyltransferase